eukprot:11306109-Alexandrium_andersonii.AAC.1
MPRAWAAAVGAGTRAPALACPRGRRGLQHRADSCHLLLAVVLLRDDLEGVRDRLLRVPVRTGIPAWPPGASASVGVGAAA